MTRDELIASLTATNEDRWWGATGEHDGRYIDWSNHTDGVYEVELGEDDDATSIRMTRDELVALHRELTATLLADS